MCIKRASHTGGCTSVASTIRCRAQQAALRDAQSDAQARRDEQQAALRDGTTPEEELLRLAEALRLSEEELLRSEEELLRSGCAPCTILPFAPVPSGANAAPESISCPAQFSEAPTLPGDSRLVTILERQGSIDASTLNEPACEDLRNHGGRLAEHPRCESHSTNAGFCSTPSITTLEWAGATGSGAVVNAPVIVSLSGVGTEFREAEDAYKFFSFYQADSYGELTNFGGLQQLSLDNALVYVGGADETISPVRQWPRPAIITTPERKSGTVYDLMESSGGGCFIRSAPYAQLIVEELWPDTNGGEITDLFGNSAMEQWGLLTLEQQEALSEARGFVYLDGSHSPDERDQELAKRVSRVPCNFSTDGQQWWCRWLPERSGYFRLTGEMAWILERLVSVRRLPARYWMTQTELDRANEYLQDHIEDHDGPCGRDGDGIKPAGWINDPACILEELQASGVATAAQAGFAEDFKSLLTPPDNDKDEALYSDAKTHIHRCPSQDVRVRCRFRNNNLFYAYETSDSIGIAVQETRVMTQAPEAGS